MGTFGRIILWIFASLGLIGVLSFIAIIVVANNLRTQSPTMPEQAILWLDLTSPVPEKRQMAGFLPQGSSQPTFLDLMKAINQAKDDPRIKAIGADLGYHGLGMAQLQEMRAALQEFQASGKPLMAFSEDLGSFGGGTLDYYLASAFGEIWLQPSGGVGLTGLAMETPFFAGAFEKLEITPRFEQRHEFKGGAEPFTRNGMSPAVRESLERLVDGWMAQIIRDVENDRAALNGQMSNLVDNGPYLAQDAWTVGLIDRLDYREAFEKDLLNETSLTEEDVVDAGFYLSANGFSGGSEGDYIPPTNIAMIYGVGTITPDLSGSGLWDDSNFGAYDVAAAIRQAREDDGIEAILLRISSPGGTYPQADLVWKEVQLTREAGKPVVAVMGNMAASGGYFAAMGADYVIAQPGTLTGSIGVYAGKFATERLWEKLGVKWDRIQSGENAGMWSMVSDFSPTELTKFRAFLDFVYEDFTSKAAKNRELNMEQIDKAARGRIWTGEDAVQVGLVDELGGMAAAEKALHRLLDLDEATPFNMITLPHEPSPLEQLEMFLSNEDPLKWVASEAISDAIEERAEAVLGDLSGLKGHAGIVQLPPMRLQD